MPRRSRIKSSSEIYHVILRGINKQNIFEDEEDYTKFLETITTVKQKSAFEIYAYCLMGNHMHLLMKEGKEDLGLIFRRIGASYVYWYNWKYKRTGHLFQDRYKSETVEDDNYLLIVLRYIHQNPIKAGIVKDVAQYKWSSYNEYVTGEKICDTDLALLMFNNDKKHAIDKYIKFMYEENEDNCLEINNETFRLTDEEAHEIMKKVSKTANASEFQKLDVDKRNKYLKELRNNGISTRQLARLTGVSRSIIMRI